MLTSKSAKKTKKKKGISIYIPTNMPYELIILDEDEYCQLTCQTNSTAQAYRLKGIGCKFLKIGKSIRYRLSDIVEYLDKCKSNSTAHAKQLKELR